MTCMNSRGRGAFRRFIFPTQAALVIVTLAILATHTAALAQSLEVRRYNPSEWTKGRFSEVVTVNGPGKTIYLAGVGAEDANIGDVDDLLHRVGGNRARGRERSHPASRQSVRVVPLRLRQDQTPAGDAWRLGSDPREHLSRHQRVGYPRHVAGDRRHRGR